MESVLSSDLLPLYIIMNIELEHYFLYNVAYVVNLAEPNEYSLEWEFTFAGRDCNVNYYFF